MAIKETDLYAPVKELLTNLGYQVKSEVNHIDVVGLKNDDLVVVELKTTLSLKLLIQGVKRQKVTHNVYIAVPMPKFKKRFSKDMKDKEYLVRRLELGLIYVSLNNKGKEPYAQIVFEPKNFSRNLSISKNKKKIEAILCEVENRNGDNNVGGTKGKLVTAYREKSLKIASLLSKEESLKPKELKELGCDDKTSQILYRNYYGWFNRIDHGRYSLSDKGKDAILEYKNIVEKL